MAKIIKKYESFFNYKKEEVNEELGWKDAVLGVLSLFAMGDIAKAGTQMTANPKLKTEIQSVLSNTSQKQDIIDSLNKHGMPRAAEYIQKNGDKVLSEIDKIGKKGPGGESTTVSIDTVKGKDANWQSIKNKLYAGYAITGIESKTLRDTIVEKAPDKTFYYDTINIMYNPQTLFEKGKFTITQDSKDSIKSAINDIHNSGCIITKVVIESSTDKQGISSNSKVLQDMGYESNNKGLSTARNDNMKKNIASIFKEAGNIPKMEQIIKYDQGKGTIGAVTEQDPSARYVKVTIYGICVDTKTPEAANKTTIAEHVIYSISFAKTSRVFLDQSHPGGGLIKSGVTKTPVLGHDVMNCPLF